jgi:acetylcholinesterase
MVAGIPYLHHGTILTIGAVTGLPVWAPYGEKPVNFVFRTDKSYVEEDNDRKEGIAFINQIIR